MGPTEQLLLPLGDGWALYKDSRQFILRRRYEDPNFFTSLEGLSRYLVHANLTSEATDDLKMLISAFNANVRSLERAMRAALPAETEAA